MVEVKSRSGWLFAWYIATSALWNSAVGGEPGGLTELMPILAPME
jgi:hypothetical protein